MKNTNLSFKPIAILFQRYHLTLFIVFVTGCLAYAVVTFSNLLASSTDTTYTSPIAAGSIDQATLERIQALHTSSDPTPPLVAPSGRIDPFSE
jgi:hypothetical protein